MKSWKFDGTVVPRHCFPFPPEYTREIWRAYKNCHVETITGSLQFNVSSPTPRVSEALHMVLELDNSMRGVFNPVRFVCGIVVLNH